MKEERYISKIGRKMSQRGVKKERSSEIVMKEERKRI